MTKSIATASINRETAVALIDAALARSRHNREKIAVVRGGEGRHAVTHYRVEEAFAEASLVRCRLETGRTHQIRVHLEAIGHPVVGDPTYGADPTLARKLGLERQWLHAMGLGFIHPGTGDYVHFESTYPQDLQTALDRLADMS